MHIRMHAPQDATARRTGSARIPIYRRETVHGLRNRDRGKAFSDAFRPRKNQAWRQRSRTRRSRQQAEQTLMTDDFAKCHSGRIVSRVLNKTGWLVFHDGTP
jgi:hypothetical protein